MPRSEPRTLRPDYKMIVMTQQNMVSFDSDIIILIANLLSGWRRDRPDRLFYGMLCSDIVMLLAGAADYYMLFQGSMLMYKSIFSKKQIIVWISSMTGNTKTVACVLIEELLREGFRIILYTSNPAMTKDLSEIYSLEAGRADMLNRYEDTPVVLCFWCRRAGMDDKTLAFLDRLSGRDILVFGTMGSMPDSVYGQRVYESVREMVGKKNRLIGSWVCRGRIDERRTMKRRSLPPSHRHYLDDEAYARHISSRSHPDHEDKEGARRFLREYIVF